MMPQTSAIAQQSASTPPRTSLESNQLEVLTEFYDQQFNLVTWQRSLSEQLSDAATQVLSDRPDVQLSLVVTPEKTAASLADVLDASEHSPALYDDVAHLVDMFCCLFDQREVGLRLTGLTRAMCPRFHVDRVPCRLVTTYHGIGTEWLPDIAADRSKLGTGNQGKPDHTSGLFRRVNAVRQLQPGDVALLKGELWEGNEGAGIIHRSPKVPDSGSRLLLTLDIID
jgi:hypothetical protein